MSLGCFENMVIKFADDTIMLSLMTNNNKYHYREEVQNLVFQKQSHPKHHQDKGSHSELLEVQDNRTRSHLYSKRGGMDGILFLGILSWTVKTSHLVKKTQRLFFLRKLKRAGLSSQILVNYNIAILRMSCVSGWQCGMEATQLRTGGAWPG